MIRPTKPAAITPVLDFGGSTASLGSAIHHHFAISTSDTCAFASTAAPRHDADGAAADVLSLAVLESVFGSADDDGPHYDGPHADRPDDGGRR